MKQDKLEQDRLRKEFFKRPACGASEEVESPLLGADFADRLREGLTSKKTDDIVKAVIDEDSVV
ncbi:MAG: hypothetical protein WC965_01315 [Thiohalomonadaceae bacterium]